MRIAKAIPPQTYLKDCFDYDFCTGMLHWKERPRSHFDTKRGQNIFNACLAGMLAGSLGSHSYIEVSINGESFLAHRIVWMLHYGTPPLEQIDHENGVRHDNRIENLRAVTNAKRS